MKYLKDNEHSFVCGKTQNGKTYFVKEEVKVFKGGVLFINPQYVSLKGFIKSDMEDNIKDIISALKTGNKIDYRPSLDDKVASKELKYIVDKLFESNFNKKHNIKIVIDETHIFNDYKEGKLATKKLANRGLLFGLDTIFISQRFSKLMDLVTQCENHYIFKTGMEKEYFIRKGIDYETLINKINKIKYSFCVFNGITLSGPYKI